MAIGGLDNADYDSDPDPEDMQSDGFRPIPKGWYDGEIVKAEDGETQDGDGKIKIQWKITGPKYANRREFQNLNTGHHKETPRNIARATLKDLGRLNGLEGRYPETEQEMEGWTAQILVDYYEDGDGNIRSSVDRVRAQTGNRAEGPLDDQPALYDRAVQQYEAQQDDNGPGGGGPKTDSFDDDEVPF